MQIRVNSHPILGRFSEVSGKREHGSALPRESKETKATSQIVQNGDKQAPSCGSMGTLKAMAFPYKKRWHALNQSIDFIGRSPLTLENLARAKTLLRPLVTDKRLGHEAQTWQAICKRLEGQDSSIEFNRLLRINPSNRLALVNLAANFFTSPGNPQSRESEGRALEQRLSTYTAAHPHDRFARLLESFFLMTRKSSLENARRAINLLELVYIEDKSYSPAISAMASIFLNLGKDSKASRFADEALSLQPDNFQAESLVQFYRFSQGLPAKDIYATRGERLIPPATSYYESILFAPYFLLDPLAKRR